MIAILIIFIGIAYCEFMWHLFKKGARSGKYVQTSMKFFIILNFAMGILLSSYGNLTYAIIISFYYYVVIPKRLLE